MREKLKFGNQPAPKQHERDIPNIQIASAQKFPFDNFPSQTDSNLNKR